jgi:hypothetical protein
VQRRSSLCVLADGMHARWSDLADEEESEEDEDDEDEYIAVSCF